MGTGRDELVAVAADRIEALEPSDLSRPYLLRAIRTLALAGRRERAEQLALVAIHTDVAAAAVDIGDLPRAEAALDAALRNADLAAALEHQLSAYPSRLLGVLAVVASVLIAATSHAEGWRNWPVLLVVGPIAGLGVAALRHP